MKMVLIPAPQWASPPEKSVDLAFDEENLQAALAQRESIVAVVQHAVQSYIDDSSLAFDTEEGFPSKKKLTGEYYIGDEHYWVNHEPWFNRIGRTREFRFSFCVRCLERLWHPNQIDQDYLGLEVHFDWLPDTKTFQHHGDVDSSVI